MPNNITSTSQSDDQIFGEVKQHSDIGFQETDRRATGKNRIGTISFQEADELFRSWIDENNWPYDALLFDPRVFTFIFEKTSRLISNKPQGHLIPREGSDILGAKINNELLSYQWDQANLGGTMLSKWALMDINTRKYGASFALAKWRYEVDSEGKCVFDGPDMQVLNNRDIAHDLSATAIENCNWFQVRQYVTIQELERVNDANRSAPVYKNLDKLKFAVKADAAKEAVGDNGGGGDTRGSNWISRNRAIAGLEQDPVGKDFTFKTVEIITEYRRDRWITFAKKHGVILRDIPNPYKNYQIPIVMLRYYTVDDDLYGLSEIEPIKGLQKAINAILCQYVDEVNQNLYSPIAIGPGVRQHTLEWGKGARWIMNNPMTDFRLVESRSNAAQYFNSTYSVLVAAMMNSLGESSLGISNVQPYQKDKTATEIKALQLQRNARDNYNQIYLAEAIKRQYLLWHTMNQVLLFSDPKTAHYIIRITGKDALRYFQERELDSMETPNEAIIARLQTYIDNGELPSDLNTTQLPKYPIALEGKPTPKLQIEEGGTGAKLYVTPEDLNGSYDFSIDVQSMTVNADEEKKAAQQAAVQLLVSNPNVVQMLAMEGVKPKFQELLVTWLESTGFQDADRFFEKTQGQQPGQQSPQELMQVLAAQAQQGGPAPTGNQGGVPGGTNPNAGGESQQQSPFSQGQSGQNAGLGPISPTSLGVQQ